MAKYHLAIRLEDAEGGSWNIDDDIEAADDDAAVNAAIDCANDEFQDGTSVEDGRTVPGAVKASIDMHNETDEHYVYRIEVTADGDVTVY